MAPCASPARDGLGEQGNGQDRAVPLALDQRARLGLDRQCRVVQHVLAPYRDPLGDRAAGGALAQAHAQRGDERAATARDRARRPPPRSPGRRCMTPTAATASSAWQRSSDQVEDAIDVQGRADRAAHLEQGLVLGRVAGGLVEEPRVLERHRGLRGEVGQDREILLGERRGAGPAPRGHHAQGPLARHEGRGQQPARERDELGHRAGRAGVVVGQRATARGQRGAGDAAADLEAEIPDPVRDIRPGARAQGVAFQQVDRGERPPDQPLGRARDDDQQLLGIELLGDVPLDHVLRLEPAEAHRRGVAELGALDGHAHLLGHRREDLQLLGQEVAPLLGDERHHAPGPVLDRDRQRELGPVGPLGRHLPDVLLGGRRGVQVRDDGLAGARGVAHA